jgi:hypothetical protein
MQDTLQSLLLSPNAPRIENATDDELARLDGYWMGVVKHLNTVLEIRRMWPGWLPEWKPVANG